MNWGQRRWVAVALATYSLGLAFILLVPSGEVPSSGAAWFADQAARAGAPDWAVTQPRAEFLCNALILMPVSALGSLLWPRATWRDWTAYAFVIASTVELIQGLLLSARMATFVDVVANTLGGLGGAAFIAAVRHLGSGDSAAGERGQELHR